MWCSGLGDGHGSFLDFNFDFDNYKVIKRTIFLDSCLVLKVKFFFFSFGGELGVVAGSL